MAKSIQLKDTENEKMYPNPYFPIGSIYLSVMNTNPTKWFGGTWELISQGRTLVGVDPNDIDFNTVKKTGGEKTHTISLNEMPYHMHGLTYYEPGAVGELGTVDVLKQESFGGWINEYRTVGTTYPRGGSQPHNNIQPYFTCYIWCRTA